MGSENFQNLTVGSENFQNFTDNQGYITSYSSGDIVQSGHLEVFGCSRLLLPANVLVIERFRLVAFSAFEDLLRYLLHTY